jgi:hypothetical protein
VDSDESTHRLSAVQGSPRVYQRRDGGYVVAHDEAGVTYVNKLTIVPRKTDLDPFEDALSNARDALEYAVRGAVGGAIGSASHEAIEDAFARYDYEVFHALEALRP